MPTMPPTHGTLVAVESVVDDQDLAGISELLKEGRKEEGQNKNSERKTMGNHPSILPQAMPIMKGERKT